MCLEQVYPSLQPEHIGAETPVLVADRLDTCRLSLESSNPIVETPILGPNFRHLAFQIRYLRGEFGEVCHHFGDVKADVRVGSSAASDQRDADDGHHDGCDCCEQVTGGCAEDHTASPMSVMVARSASPVAGRLRLVWKAATAVMVSVP